MDSRRLRLAVLRGRAAARDCKWIGKDQRSRFKYERSKIYHIILRFNLRHHDRIPDKSDTKDQKPKIKGQRSRTKNRSPLALPHPTLGLGLKSIAPLGRLRSKGMSIDDELPYLQLPLANLQNLPAFTVTLQ